MRGEAGLDSKCKCTVEMIWNTEYKPVTSTPLGVTPLYFLSLLQGPLFVEPPQLLLISSLVGDHT